MREPSHNYDSDLRTLDVEPGASLEEIRQAYRDLTKIWHPDRFSNDIRLQKKAEKRLKQINLAYQRLCEGEPYNRPVLNPPNERPPSEWIAVFVALRRALTKSGIAITKRFGLVIEKAVSEINKLFQWCLRQRRSLGIAATAFLLGFVSGVWFLAKPSPRVPTVLSEEGPLTASSLKTTVPVPPPSIATSSSLPITRLAGDAFSWKTAIVTTVFWVGEEQVAGKTSPQHQSVWDKDWLKSFGGVDDPEPAARHDYIPISFVPNQNPFYFALPYNDVMHGQFKPEAPLVIPWFKQSYTRPGESVCRNRWVAIRKGNRICYAQWEDCGPFRSDHFQYVFGNERPKPNLNHGAGLNVSPAVRDYLGLATTDVTDWKFVEVRDVPRGPWRSYGENNNWVIARRQNEQMRQQQAQQKSQQGDENPKK